MGLNAEGGSRTHMARGHTPLKRARLPVSPLRPKYSKSISTKGFCVNEFSWLGHILYDNLAAMGQAIATNKKAFRDYHFTGTWECGIELKGAEVKSIREGKVNFKDSFARPRDGEIYLYNLHIDPYPQASYLNEDPERPRKLLLHKQEIRKILGYVTQRHVALIPTKMYFSNRGFVKVELALGTGKKLYDKREAIKKKDIARDLSRRLKKTRR